jgi:hypothetical protein
MHLAAAGATRAAEKAALIDAHDLAENERGGGAEDIRARLSGGTGGFS